MKAPKHSNLGLPIGTRIRFVLGKNKHTFVGTIVEGIPLDAGMYWIRQQHGFQPFKLKAKAIKFIEFIPGAPQPAPMKQTCPKCGRPSASPASNLCGIALAGRNCNPPCPPPQPRSTRCPNWVDGVQCIHPVGHQGICSFPYVVRAAKRGEGAGPIVVNPLTLQPLPPQPPQPAPRSLVAPPPAIQWGPGHTIDPAPAKAPVIDWNDQTGVLRNTLQFLTAIQQGALDGDLEKLQTIVWERLKIVRALVKSQVIATLAPGDRVKITGKIRPRWIVGTTGVVKAIGSSKVDVTFDSPVPRFGKGAKIPANCLTKL